MAYSEILNEIDEQIEDINTSILKHQTDAEDAQALIHSAQQSILQLQSQLEGLNALKANAQSLIDNQNTVDINLNVSVSGAGEGSSVIQHSNSTAV